MDDILMDLLDDGSIRVGLVDRTFLSENFFSSFILRLDNSLLLVSYHYGGFVDLLYYCFSSTEVRALARNKLLLLLLHVWRALIHHA